MRSSQLDAERLDEELTSMLREQLLRCATWVLKPGLLARLQPELTLLLDLLVSWFDWPSWLACDVAA